MVTAEMRDREIIDIATGERVGVGDMFEWPRAEPEKHREEYSDQYWSLPEPRRPPIAVIVPGGHLFCVDNRFYKHPKGWHGTGWRVSGQPPALTLTPSIHLVGRWHGYLEDGVLRTV